MCLIGKAYNYIDVKLNDMANESGVTTMINRNESRKRAASNLSVKINGKMRRLNTNNCVTMNDNVLVDMIKVIHRENPNSMKPCKPRKAKLMKSTGLTQLVPPPCKFFTLREAFLYIRNEGMKVNIVFQPSY